MPTLAITKSYADGDVLFEADLDNIKTDLETFINTTKLDDDNIQDSGITASTKLVDGSLTTGKIAADAITTIKIADSNVTTAKIADSAVTTAKIADSNVTTDKLANSVVITAKIADGAVTYAKRAALNYVLTSSCGSFSTSSTTYADVTNLTATITTNGRPVIATLVPDGSGEAAFSPAANLLALIQLYNATSAVSIGEKYLNMSVPGAYYGTSASFIWVPTAGEYVIKIRTRVSGSTVTIQNFKLLVYEL